MDNQELLKAIDELISKRLKEELEPIKNDINGMKEDINGIKATQQEHGQILRALEERTKVTQAEVENLKYDVAEIKGTVTELKNKQDLIEDVTANNWVEIVRMKRKQA